MNKKKTLVACIAILVIAFGVYQGTMANFNEQGTLDSKMSAGTLGIQFMHNGTILEEDSFDFSKAMPGAMFEKDISIANIKDKDLYTRVTLTRYWVDEQGNKVVEANAKYINIMNDSEDWVVIEDKGSNDERIMFYYKKPINSKDASKTFMNGIKLSEDIEDQQYSRYKAHIELEAEAVQKAGASDAILSQWGIDITFDNDGNIINIVE